MVHPNQSLLKISEKRERDVSRDCSNFGVPQLSQERLKLRTSNFVSIFIASIGRKSHKKSRKNCRGHSQGLPKMFRALIHRAHRAVIFAFLFLSKLINIFEKLQKENEGVPILWNTVYRSHRIVLYRPIVRN